MEEARPKVSLIERVKRGKSKGMAAEEADATTLLSGRVDDVDKKINAAAKDVSAVRTDLGQLKTMLAGFLDEYKSWKGQINTKVQTMAPGTPPVSAPPSTTAAASPPPFATAPSTAPQSAALAAPPPQAPQATPPAAPIDDLLKVSEALTNAARIISDYVQKIKSTGASQNPGT